MPATARSLYIRIVYLKACIFWFIALGVTTYNIYTPDLSAINKKLTNYIAVEFEKCFNVSVFEDLGVDIIKPVVNYQAIDFDFSKTNIKIDVSLNNEDVSVRFNYPLTVKEGKTETKFDSFTATLPIRFKALYNSAISLVENIRNTQPNAYDITSDCSAYDKNDLTNVYLKNSDDQVSKIIQFVDFSTYKEHYVDSYIFQFAVKNVNVDGSCVG